MTYGLGSEHKGQIPLINLKSAGGTGMDGKHSLAVTWYRSYASLSDKHLAHFAGVDHGRPSPEGGSADLPIAVDTLPLSLQAARAWTATLFSLFLFAAHALLIAHRVVDFSGYLLLKSRQVPGSTGGRARWYRNCSSPCSVCARERPRVPAQSRRVRRAATRQWRN